MIRSQSLINICWLFAFLVFFSTSQTYAQSSGGVRTSVVIGGNVNATAGPGGTASNQIGSTSGGCAGSSDVKVQGNVSAYSMGGKAVTKIGDPCHKGRVNIGGNVTNNNARQSVTGDVSVGGNIYTAPGTNLKMGGNSSVAVGGNVGVLSGTLELGDVCAGRRNGQCCIQFYTGLCVLNQVPPNPKTGCPTGYVLAGGLCRLYSDFGGHRVEGY